MAALPSPFGIPTGDELINVGSLATKLLEPQLIKGLHLAKETFFGEKPATAEPPADDINAQLKAAYAQQQSAGDDLKVAYAKQQEESGAQNDTLKRIFQLNQDIRSKTAQQLYDDPAFDPFEAFQTLEADLTPEDVEKLVETRKLQTAPGLHLKRRARALVKVPEAVSQFIKGGPQLLSRFADLGSPDKAIRTKAAAEIVTGAEQANLEVSDLLRTGLRKAKDNILDPSSITSIVRGSGLGIKFQDSTDHKQRFFTDLAHRRQIEGALEGKGFWTTLAGLDAKTLSEKGIEVDPDAIQNLSEWLDLTNFIPFGAGFKVAKQGARTTLRAADAGIAESFLARARQKTAETLQKAGAGIEKRGIWTGAGFGRGGTGGAVIDIALGGTGLVGAGFGLLGGVVSPAAIRAAGRSVKFAGTQLAKPGPMLRLAEMAAGAAARGAAAGTVASIPFAAAAETPEEQTLIAGVGAGLGTAGGVAALPVMQAQKGIAGIVNKSFEGAADLRPVARHSKPDSIDAGLESTHQGLMDRLEQLDPNYYNLVQRMRALVGAVGGELFFTDPATFKQRAGRTAEGAILEGDIEQINPNGTTRRVPYMLVEFNGQRTPESLFHEPGHLLFKVMPEESRNAITAAIQDTFTPEQLQEINAGYAEWLGSPGNVIDEIASELISGVLRGSDLTGFEQSKFPKVQTLVQSAYEAAANALDQLGLYDITQSAAPGAVGQQLGFGLSPKVGDIVRGYLRSPEQAEAIKAAISELERTATPPTLVQPVTRKPVVEPARRAPTAIPATPADREQAATDAEQIATSASPIVPPGGTRSARELLGDIAAAIAQQVGVKINYLSALDEPAAAISSNRAARREMIELFRSMPQSARALWEKTFFPERLIQTGTGIQVLGWAPEVFAANAHKISKSVGNKSALLPYPVDPKTGTFTDAGWQALFQDTQTFVRNQLSGRTGAGEGLVVPADLQNRGFYKPPVTGPSAPLDQRKADFINLLFGIPLPKTPRITTGKLPLNIAGQDISVETKPGRVSVPVEPRAKFGEGSEKARAAAEQLGITGREILEVNPLRAELEAAGVKLPGLIEAVQRLDANNIKEVQLAPEQPQFRGNTLTLSAGFQPKAENPRAVKEAAVRDEGGKIFTGRWHGEATEAALEFYEKRGFLPELDEDGNLVNLVDGFVTNSGEFLSREGAFRRAEELSQITKEAANEMRTANIENRLESAELESHEFNEARQFQPPREDRSDEREMPMAPGQRLIEVLGPDGTVYKARFDGYQEVPGRAPVAQITPVDGFPWQGDSKRSTTYETTIVKRGFTVPELPTPEQWESERVETGFTQFQPNREVQKVADEYAGRPLPHGIKPPVVNPALARELAEFYESAEHAPANEAVRASYEALRAETLLQLDAIEAAGYVIEPWTGKGEPYKSSADMATDVNQNKHLYFKKTGTEVQPDNLMAEFNDIFRAVHDFFGHAAEGYQFGPRGELAAWNAHSEMYSPAAQGALAAETLAQNSWVNFGKHLEGKNIPLPDRPFAEQKNVVVPAELISEAKAQFQPKRKVDESLKFAGTQFNEPSKAWILPNGTVAQLGAQWHHAWLDDNIAVKKKYGLQIPPFEGGDAEGVRETALKKGFARLVLDQGLLTVEAREKDWKRIRPQIEDMIERNIDDVDRFRVSLLNDSISKVTKSFAEKIFDLDSDKEKMDKVFETFAEQPQGEIGAQFQPSRAAVEKAYERFLKANKMLHSVNVGSLTDKKLKAVQKEFDEALKEWRKLTVPTEEKSKKTLLKLVEKRTIK